MRGLGDSQQSREPLSHLLKQYNKWQKEIFLTTFIDSFYGRSDVYQHTIKATQRPSICNPGNIPQVRVFGSHRKLYPSTRSSSA